MTDLSVQAAIANAPTALQPALEWFHDRTGQGIDWPKPSPVPGLAHVVSSAKGIYKPSGYDVALTVRQVLASPYADRDIVATPDGGWIYGYHQEGADPSARDEDFTNRGLMENWHRQVPVAVLIQTKASPGTRYLVQGLALVVGWDAGFFYLRGFGRDGSAPTDFGPTWEDSLRAEAAALAESHHEADVIDPEHDGRVRTVASIVRRQGQAAFRAGLLRAYGGRCAVTGCDVEPVLDAAHVLPYRGPHTNTLTNGLLLRTDLHTLLDLGQVAIDPHDRTLILAPQLRDASYLGELHGKRIAEPASPQDRPAADVLALHLDWFGVRNH